MKKKITILMLGLMVILITTLTLTVNAANATATLSTVETQQPGDEFTITFSAECTTELEGIDANLIYDKTKLEFIEADKANSNWNVMDTDLSDVQNSNYDRNIAAYCNQAKAEDDIFVMTFNVKETAAVGTTAKISLNGIVLYDTNDQSYDIGTKEIEVSIVEEPTNPNPGETPGEDEPGETPDETPQEKTLTSIEVKSDAIKLEYNVGEKFEKAGLIVKATYSDGTSKEITNYTITNGDKLEVGQTSVTISYTENGITKTTAQEIKVVEKVVNDDEFEEIKEDNTKTEEKMPNTGVPSVIGIITIVVVFGIVCLVRYNKYKEI